jgi:hypothetical protein
MALDLTAVSHLTWRGRIQPDRISFIRTILQRQMVMEVSETRICAFWDLSLMTVQTAWQHTCGRTDKAEVSMNAASVI